MNAQGLSRRGLLGALLGAGAAVIAPELVLPRRFWSLNSSMLRGATPMETFLLTQGPVHAPVDIVNDAVANTYAIPWLFLKNHTVWTDSEIAFDEILPVPALYPGPLYPGPLYPGLRGLEA